MVKMIKFLFFAQKVSSGMGGIAPQIFRGLAALEPPKMGGKGEGFVFSIFNRKRKRKWKKYFVHFVGNLSRIPKLFFFHSSMKTEEVLFLNIYIYIYVYIYLYIYIKNKALKGKIFKNKKCFFFDFTYCVKISVRSDQ